MIAEVVAIREVQFIESVVNRGALTEQEARQVVEEHRPEVLAEIGKGIREAFADADAATADAVNSAVADADQELERSRLKC